MGATLLILTLALGPLLPFQEKPRVPDDSIELTVIGCLKGRVLSTVERRGSDVERGPDVGARIFRLSGKKDVMNEVKRRNRQLVEVVGIVKRSALDDQGIRSGGIAISGGPPVARDGGMPTGIENVPVMDVTDVRLRSTSCRGE